jgi:hypothetical protein
LIRIKIIITVIIITITTIAFTIDLKPSSSGTALREFKGVARRELKGVFRCELGPTDAK